MSLVVLAASVVGDPRLVPSPLLERPAPSFSLSRVHDADAVIGSADLRGQVVVLNVWASWCLPCRLENDLLLNLADSGEAALYGLNYKDQRSDAVRWLGFYGNPYVASGHDPEGQVSGDFGVDVVPQTFVIDREGIIRFRHVGPIDEVILDEQIVPLVRALGRQSA
jgi:cytochrome c biogenesis protein CcmG/thiol:disulfide interchange protein DsbE